MGKVWVSIILLLLPVGAAAAPVAEASSLRTEFGIYWKGIRIFSMEAESRVGEGTYEVDLSYRTRGLVRLFSKGQGEVRARGSTTADGVQAQEYLSRGHWDGEDFSRQLLFGEDGRMVTMNETWPEKWREDYPQEPVPAEMQTGPDPMGMIAEMLMALGTPEGSPGTVEGQAFDGDSVRRWRFSCAEDATVLEPSRHSPFAGPAFECAISAEIVAGKFIETEKLRKEREKAERKAAKRRAKGEDDEGDRMRLWVAAPEGSPYLLPVRAEFPSGFGKLRFFLTEITTGDLAKIQPE